MSNSIGKVMVLGSSKAERIGDTNKMNIVVKAAALDIENNFLPLEVMNVYVNDKLIDTMTSDQSGELHMDLQLDYDADTEVIVQAEHKASGQKSPKKLITITDNTGLNSTVIKPEKEIKVKEIQQNPISKGAAIAALRKNGLALSDIKFAHLIDDTAVVMEAVKQNGLALEFASERLKKDISIFNIAVEQNEDAALFADGELYAQYKIALQDAKFQGIIYPKFNDTRPLVILALKIGNYYIEQVSARLMDDKDVVLAAVKKDSNAFIYASSRLQDDKDVVLAAVNRDPTGLKYASLRLKDDKDIVLAAVKKYSELYPEISRQALNYASDRLRNDPEIKKAIGL